MHGGQLLDGFITYKSNLEGKGGRRPYIYIYIYHDAVWTAFFVKCNNTSLVHSSCLNLPSRASFFIARVSALWEPVLGSSQLLLNTVVWRRMEEKRYINIASGTIWRRCRELLKCKLHYHSSPRCNYISFFHPLFPLHSSLPFFSTRLHSRPQVIEHLLILRYLK